MPRILAFVMDSAGVGALPDASAYHDGSNANTIGNVAQQLGGLRLPNFERLGLGCITSVRGVAASERPAAVVARLRERSKGKDTITGHWEMAGVITEVPFPTYPDGFPPEVIERFTAITGAPPLGNIAASGTEIIAELGEEHQRTGRPILYTSADSVFQVAAHEETVPLATLYDWCERARAMLVSPHEVNRVIARPFVGVPGAYVRTPNRRDYAIPPPPTVLDRLEARGVPVHAVGKICDIYSGHGIASSVRVADNGEAVDRALELADATDHGLVFVNLNDFDTKFGHRRDVRGYGDALARLDARLPEILARIRPGDGLIFTADHGCDPTQPGTDHTREYVPYLECGLADGADLGVIDGLGYVGERIESCFQGLSMATAAGRR
ncbi:phosphopentomutase [Vulcanimicrobium alpinum]|uniref:Phosphopentomutase n=1 Tax=Vulcanimicrobium alpinum TaxID=3016050 RepID=A0AAN2CBE8_UNVUL|nr:phosphopentomutase [Vulcanimicrobium alpinum]BDE07677.1 phosphopentomutase [Vulcanimicrobium alpinum]